MTQLVHDALLRLRPADGATRVEDVTLIDESGAPFDMEAYSRLKYGDRSLTRDYGYGLARVFIDRHPALANDPGRMLVTSASYKYLSTASEGIAEYFFLALNAFRVQRGLEPAMKLHVIRFKIGKDDYATATAAERAHDLHTTVRHLDTELVRGSVVVVIDDARITGSTELRALERLLPCEPAAICSLHVAIVDEEWASRDENAGIENVMNKTLTTTLNDIAAAIEAGNFRLNTRVFRAMMECPDPDAFYQFLTARSDAFLEEMYTALVSGMVEMYNRSPQGTSTLEQVISERKLGITEFINSAQ